MSRERPADDPETVRPAVVALSIGAAFLLLRALVVHTRTVFFDELFSVWMARRPLAALLDRLKVDSGPPLYYVVARIPDVLALRWLSIAFAAVPLVVLLRQRRWLAALLLAVHPAAALFAATARPYALAASLIAIAILLIEQKKAGRAAVALVAAAYVHYLSAVFFPVLLFCAVSWRRRITAVALAGLAFVPGLLLAATQPGEATAWMSAPDLQHVLTPLAFLSDDPGVPLAITALAAALTLAAASRSWRRAPFVLVPLVVLVGLSFVRPSLYGIRFSSLLAFPLVLWLEESLDVWGGGVRRVLTVLLAAVGCVAIVAGALEHLNRPEGDYREAAVVLRENVRSGETIVATGYLFLESSHQLPGRTILAFPVEQGVHPGWRVPAGRPLDPAELPPREFVWIGERGSPELGLIGRTRPTRVLFGNRRAVILRVGEANSAPKAAN